MRSFVRAMRILSLITLFFFCWSFLPLYAAVAYAATDGRKASGVRGEGKARPAELLAQTSGERFEQALEAIREKIGKAVEKAGKNQDITAEVTEVKAKRAEIESLDLELRREFRATEKKLKDAGLPQEIMDRHYKFVKHYEDNLAELKKNLGEVEQYTVDSKQGKEALRRAKLHLEKTKAPSKHVPLDPNNLPFRARKAAKPIPPRLKKEQFERDFGPAKNSRPALGRQHTVDSILGENVWQHAVAAGFSLRKEEELNNDTDQHPRLSPLGTGLWTRILDSALRTRHSALEQKPLLLAYNGPASDMPLVLPRPSEGEGWGLPSNALIGGEGRFELPAFVFSELNPRSTLATPNLMVAQATGDLPTADDLAETPEVQFTPEIRTKAQQLEYNPVKIFNWVRNNIDYQPYYGSFKGAAQTLAEGAGNDFDQASLLIALLRISNIAAKYSYGTVELNPDKVMNWLGVTDIKAAGAVLATMGIPATLMKTSSGVYKAVQMEKVWVEAWIDYFPSWGAKHKQGGEDTWIPLDPSFKQYAYKQGMDMYALMGFNAEEFLASYISDTRDITAYQDYSMRMLTFLDANYPDASVEDVLGAAEIRLTKTIVKQEFPYLLGTLPYRIIVNATEFNQIPQTKDYSIAIQIEGDILDGTPGLNYSEYLTSLANKRITISYEAASLTDETLIAQYGGNALDVPPYLLTVRPVLKIFGTTVATGAPIGLGKEQNIVISFVGPDGDADRIQNVITSGVYTAIILQSQSTPSKVTGQHLIKLINSINDINSLRITMDDLIGQLLYSIGISYFQRISFENSVYANNMNLINLRQPAEAMVTHGVKVDYLYGLPYYIVEGGINIDVDRNINIVVSPTQDDGRTKAFMMLSGLSSSAWENKILEAFFDGAAVSAVSLLKLASAQGIPVHTINSGNINDILPLLQVSFEVKTDISNAVNAGKNVIISQTEIIDNQWHSVGYIVLNPATGAAGYMISRGLAGGDTSLLISLKKIPEWVALDYWRTYWTRGNALRIARGYKDTLYVFGGCDKNGLDCSGLLREVYPVVNGEGKYGGAQNIYNDCEKNKWLHSSEYRFPGEIIWNASLGHTGIEAGINTITWPPHSKKIVKDETAVHASGRPCFRSTEEAPDGTPDTCIFDTCTPVDPDNPEWGGNPSCGKYNLVVESPLKVFLYKSSLHSNSCSPR